MVSGGDATLAWGTGGVHYPSEVPSAYRQRSRAAVRVGRQAEGVHGRPPRRVPLKIAVKRVTCKGARRPGGRFPPVEVVAVYAKECRPPRGRGAGCMALAHEPTAGGFPECLPSCGRILAHAVGSSFRAVFHSSGKERESLRVRGAFGPQPAIS